MGAGKHLVMNENKDFQISYLKIKLYKTRRKPDFY